MTKRGLEKDRFLFTGEEMRAVNLGMQIHDEQLNQSSIAELEKMTDFVVKQIRLKKARRIEKGPEGP